MMRANPLTEWNQAARLPFVDPGAFVDPDAVLIGEVQVESGVIICPGAVLRADEGSPIIVRRGSNIQDGVIIHALLHSFVEVGPSCSIAHGAILHGPCSIAADCFVGFRATVFSARLGHGCFIGHGALVLNVDLPEATLVPPGAVITTPDDVDHLSSAEATHRAFNIEVRRVNEELRRGYLAQDREAAKQSYAL